MRGEPFDTRDSKRLSRALVVALGVHALALLGHGARRIVEQRSRGAQQELWIDVAPPRTASVRDPRSTGGAMPSAARASEGVRVARRSDVRTSAPGTGEPQSVLELPAPPAAGSAESPRSPLTLEQLGVGSNNPLLWLMPPPTAEQRAEYDREREQRRNRVLTDRETTRRARNVEKPVLPPLIALLKKSAVAPNTSALLLIRADPDGHIVDAKVLNASGDVSEWRRVARDLVPALGKTRLSLRTSSGFSLRIRADTFLRLPSGARVGGGSTKISPLEYSQGFDLSDIGAVPVLDAEAKLEALTPGEPAEVTP